MLLNEYIGIVPLMIAAAITGYGYCYYQENPQTDVPREIVAKIRRTLFWLGFAAFFFALTGISYIV